MFNRRPFPSVARWILVPKPLRERPRLLSQTILGCFLDTSQLSVRITMELHSLTLDEACAFLQISRPTATNWIRSGRLQATRKDPTKPKSPFLTTRQACIAALNSPLHTIDVSAGDAHKRIANVHLPQR